MAEHSGGACAIARLLATRTGVADGAEFADLRVVAASDT